MMHTKPGDIERTSLSIIRRELEARGIVLPEETDYYNPNKK